MKRYVIVFVLFLAGCMMPVNPPINKAKMADGYYMKGMSYYQTKDYELASVEFNRSIQTDSKNKKSYYMLGIISASQGDLDDAVTYYKHAIDIDSNYSDAYNALGTVYSQQQKWDMALKSFHHALENKLYPTPHIVYLNIGRLYMARKDYRQAVEAFRDAKRYVNEDYIIYELGRALFEEGNTKEAIDEFQEGVEIAPQNANLRYNLALALLKSGSKKAALVQFKKTVELAPKSELAKAAKDYIKTLR